MARADERTEPSGTGWPLSDSPPAPFWRRLAPWAFGLIALSGVVVATLHIGEVGQFIALAESARPEWLLLALAAQAATYGCQAAVWHGAVRRAGFPLGWASLLPLGIAKIFTEQAVPSGGISGVLLAIRGLIRRGVPMPTAMAVMLVAMVSTYSAYLTAMLGALAIVGLHHRAGPAVWGGAAIFAVVAVAIPGGVLWFRRWRDRPPPRWLNRFPRFRPLFDAVIKAPADLLRDPRLMARASALQLLIFVLDAATLWIIFHALGQDVGFQVAYAGFITASVTATVAPAPGGLGTFEAGSVAMLTALGVPIESALAATLLLRGFTFWLPMVPGLWLARRELAGRELA